MEDIRGKGEKKGKFKMIGYEEMKKGTENIESIEEDRRSRVREDRKNGHR